MRWGLIAWCTAGVLVLGLKAYLDMRSAQYPDVAIRGGDAVYRVPVRAVTNADGWRADLARLSGCWDVREAGMLHAAAGVAGCHEPHALHLDFTRVRGAKDDLLARYAQGAAFWLNYEPPREQLEQAVADWGRSRLVYRADWKLFRMETSGSPWIFLFAGQPQVPGQIAWLFAGRCFRPDTGTDIGMFCTFAERLPGGLALEYSFGPDAVPEFPALRAAALRLVQVWKVGRRSGMNAN